MKDFSGMRDCVKDLLSGECPKELRRPARFWILSELRRLGFTEEESLEVLLEWNGRLSEPFKQRNIKRDIIGAVKWACARKEMLLSCGKNGVLRGIICKKLNGEYCNFSETERDSGNARRQKEKPEIYRFELLGWPQFLYEHHGPNGYAASCAYKALHAKLVLENLTFEDTIYLSFRKMSQLIQSRIKTESISKSACVRGTRILEDYGLIECVSKGQKGPRIKKGERVRKANGYRIVLPVPPVPEKPVS